MTLCGRRAGVQPDIDLVFCIGARKLMTFSALGLSEPLLRALGEAGFEEPTTVQTAAIPAILRGLDVLASAKTGSGKTAAFVLPLLQQHADRPAPGSGKVPVSTLVLVPTRELATQVAETFASLSRCLANPPRCCVAIGGVSINPQLLALRGGADVVIATPGRLLDLVDHNALQLSSLRTLVLDEADRLLSLGFAAELGRVQELLPNRRQNLLFSATFPPSVKVLVDGLLKEPVAIDVDGGATPDPSSITQRAIAVDEGRRTALLLHLLEAHAWSRVLVFVATKYATEHVTDKLKRRGIAAAPLHGELTQGARTQGLSDFKAGRLQVLIATDLAGRGLDIVELPVVLNYDLPRSPTDYLHRIGRTGRAGESGVAVSFVTARSSQHFSLIERRHGLSLEREIIAGFEPTEVAVLTDPNGGVKGKRKSKKDKLREARARGSRS